MAKRNNDVLCLGREDIIVAYYVTAFSLLSCYQTANCTALILWENFTINPANFLIISAHITSLFRAICRYASSDGGLMWLYLKTCLKVSSKHAKSKSIYTYSEWLGAIEWDEVWCKSSCWKNIAALREESFISKIFTVSCSASRTKKQKKNTEQKLSECNVQILHIVSPSHIWSVSIAVCLLDRNILVVSQLQRSSQFLSVSVSLSSLKSSRHPGLKRKISRAASDLLMCSIGETWKTQPDCNLIFDLVGSRGQHESRVWLLRHRMLEKNEGEREQHFFCLFICDFKKINQKC